MAIKKAAAVRVVKPVKMDTNPVPTKEPAPTVTPDPNGDIDQRMAALLKDHVAMGARPK